MYRRTFLTLTAAGSLITAAGAKNPAQAVSRSRCPLDRTSNPISIESLREQFPLPAEPVWFNTGGLGAVSTPVLSKVTETMYQLQSAARHGHELIDAARPVLAQFIGCRDDEIAFTRNATEGNSTVASGLKLRPGDEVIIDSHAHQGGSLAWITRQKFDGIVIKIFDPDPRSVESNLQRIESLITSRTRVIQVSHVTAPTGIRMPVEQIGRLAAEHGIWFHIDGAVIGDAPVQFSGT